MLSGCVFVKGDMKLSITVIVLCLVPMVWGQTLNQGDGSLQVQGRVILDLQLRLSAVERLRNEDALRIADISKQQQINQRRIADLEKQQQIDHQLLSDLVNKRDEDNRTIVNFGKMQQDDHYRIDDLEKKRQDDQKRISNLEKQQRFFIGRITDLEEKIGNGDLLRIAYPQKQRHHRILDSNSKFPFDSITNSTSRTTDVRRVPSVKKTKSFRPNLRHSELPSPSLETMAGNQGIKKRVSSDNEGMVAFYAVLTHNYDAVTHLMEIHFDRVITNIGGSYSGQTGTFTCRNAGVYVFLWTVRANTRYLCMDLVKNGAVIGTGFAGDSPYSITGTGSVVVYLDQGDDVWVRVGGCTNPGTYILADLGTNVFSGFLLR